MKILSKSFLSVAIVLAFCSCGGGSSGSSSQKDQEDKNTSSQLNNQNLNQTKSTNIKVLKTGQISPYKSEDDGDWRFGIKRDFTRDDATNTVIDNTNNLIWQDEAYTPKEVKAYTNKKEFGKVTTWQNAQKYCAKKGSGWRLPSIKELSTIVNYGVLESKVVDSKTGELNDSKGVLEPVFNYGIDKSLGEDAGSQPYWSSTQYLDNVYYLSIDTGLIQFGGYKDETFVSYVRCVKDKK